MTTLIIGAAGMIGRKIATTLSNETLILADVVAAPPNACWKPAPPPTTTSPPSVWQR